MKRPMGFAPTTRNCFFESVPIRYFYDIFCAGAFFSAAAGWAGGGGGGSAAIFLDIVAKFTTITLYGSTP